MLISLIVPCYNESESLPLFYEKACKVTNDLKDYDFEFIFIDDGSKDDTLKIIKDFAQKDSRVFYYSFSKNFGKEAAMYAGFCNVKGDYVAVMDADLQDPPSLLPEMLKILETKEYDSVATYRKNRKGEPKLRSWFAKKFYKLINKVSDANIVNGARDFRLMKREMVDVIVSMSEYNRFSKGIFGWVGFKTYWLDYENVERVAGKTKWSFWKLFKYAIDGIINFSQAPLRVAYFFGILMTVLSLFIFGFVFIRWLASGVVITSLATIISVVLFVAGIQLFCLGIIGQYIAKIHLESKNRPHYIISQTNDENVKKIK